MAPTAAPPAVAPPPGEVAAYAVTDFQWWLVSKASAAR